MRRFVDLHTHSNASDGAARPAELIEQAERRRLAAVALTDHDTTDGLAEAQRAAAQFPGLRFVPGVEVSAKFTGGTMHILGLGIDPESPRLREIIAQLRQARDERNPRIIAALQAMGIRLDMSDVLAAARQLGGGSTIGRLHIAQALRLVGCVRTVGEAFDRLIGQGRPAFVDKEHLSPAKVVTAIRDSGGAAVLAHPSQLNCRNRAQLERVVRGLMRHGLGGIEAYHTDHADTQTRMYLDLARRLGIGITGGSDYHGSAKPDARLGRPRVPLSAIDGPLREILLPEQT
ncbi:MAG TPA: PHP domain-containing protein [Phycisphaerae bacterium]|nr:PHP domain-containing protein [Phycisphaerae bacterium]